MVTWGSGASATVNKQIAVDVQHVCATDGAFAALKAGGGSSSCSGSGSCLAWPEGGGSVVAWGKEDELEEVKTLALRHA